MVVGWSRDGAVQEQIDATVESGVQLAKSRLPGGESLTHCEECEVAIPEGVAKQCLEFDIVLGVNQNLKKGRSQLHSTIEGVAKIVN